MKKKLHNPVDSSSFSSLTSNASVNRNISSIFSQLLPDIHGLVCHLSLEEKEALAYVIKWNDQENKKRSTSKPHATSFQCGCSKCKSVFTEIWFESEYHDDMKLFFKCAMEHKNGNNRRGGKNKKKAKNDQEMSLQEIRREGEGSSSNDVNDLTPLIGELGLQGSGSDVVQNMLLETTEVALSEGGSGSDVVQNMSLETTEVALSEGGRRGSRKSFSRILFPDVLGVCSSRLCRLWYPIVREEDNETSLQEIHREGQGSCSNSVKDLTPLIGELGLQSGGSDVIQKMQQEKTEVCSSEGGRRGSHKSYSRILFPDVLGVCNSRLWRLWYPIVRDEEEKTAMKH